ncbi:MAG: M28 family peptidase, partial [Armatimonadota bacterium]
MYLRRVALLICLVCLLLVSSSYAADLLKTDPVLYKQYTDKYKELASEVNSSNLSKTINVLASQGSRLAGYPGCEKAGKYVLEQFKSIGLENINAEPFDATVPVDKGASIQVKDKEYKLYPMWPNFVRTSQLPKEGVSGPLIYGGSGKLSEFNGYNVDGSVVMMEFNSGSEWLNAPRLGAKAVIFIEPDDTMRGEAEAKFISIPISIPRFWISKSDAAALRAKAAVSSTSTATLKCNMPWERRQTYNISGIIKGTDPDPEIANQIIVIESFYDSTSVVPSLAPGAESACGLASMLELARIFKKNPPKRTVWFIATSAHYQSLQGIREYIEK